MNQINRLIANPGVNVLFASPTGSRLGSLNRPSDDAAAADGDFANLRLPNKTSRSETSYGPLARWPIPSLVAMFALMVLYLHSRNLGIIFVLPAAGSLGDI